MTTKYELPKNSDEYKRLAEMLASLTEYEMNALEKEKEASEVIRKFPVVISLVNVLGFLRGLEGAFRGLDISDADTRSYIKANENIFESRLSDLILSKIRETGMRMTYRNKLRDFFVNFRDYRDGDDVSVTNTETAEELYQKVKEYVISQQMVSATDIQMKFRLGFTRASSIVMRLEEEGVISVPNVNRKREVLIK